MPFIETGIPDLLIFQPQVFEDARGYFFESYNKNVFLSQGLDHNWLQDNQSSSSFGVIRGLHFQVPPKAQTKLVRVLEGSICDVAIDIRKGSPAYGRAYTIELSAENKLQLLIPKGFAHGFSVISERAVVLYKCDTTYDKSLERGILYNDPQLNINWNIPENKIILSEKDKVNPLLADFESPFIFEKA
ncbi:MAG: dTDP-4-dehydrorhamnose 3,5-epimerase [Chitinophagaceae bacterium]|nr:dTDP-4-dehydrorhamnose 3,5-epimerase [Chitinophagaceae bacterium]MCW5927699.1 dTDP-4-dehydrorhamnose 3,5-epimerase [Chitinophagaceae bacterium]